MTSLFERFHLAASTDETDADHWLGAEAHVVTDEAPPGRQKPRPIVDDLDDPEWLPL